MNLKLLAIAFDQRRSQRKKKKKLRSERFCHDLDFTLGEIHSNSNSVITARLTKYFRGIVAIRKDHIFFYCLMKKEKKNLPRRKVDIFALISLLKKLLELFASQKMQSYSTKVIASKIEKNNTSRTRVFTRPPLSDTRRIRSAEIFHTISRRYSRWLYPCLFATVAERSFIPNGIGTI